MNGKIYLTPGPTELYPQIDKFVIEAINENLLSANHRSDVYIDIHKKVVQNLKSLMNIPDDFDIFFVSSATECMDILIRSTVRKNSFHFVNGAFAERFYKTSLELNKVADSVTVEYGESFEFTEINNKPELIAFTQNETSTGVYLDPEFIYQYKKLFPNAVIAVDIVTSAPYVNLDFSKIDAAFFSVQKGFGLPAGLGVLITNKKVLNKSLELKSSGISIGSFHNIPDLKKFSDLNQTTETPNVLNIFLLNKVTEDMLRKGIGKIRQETIEKAELIYNFFDNYKYKPFVKNKKDRSPTIIVIDTRDETEKIKSILKSNGIIVGGGYGKFKNSQIRISNFPGQEKFHYEKLINILSKS